MKLGSVIPKLHKYLGDWIATPVTKRAVIYAGDFENNMATIQIINYKHLHTFLNTTIHATATILNEGRKDDDNQ